MQHFQSNQRRIQILSTVDRHNRTIYSAGGSSTEVTNRAGAVLSSAGHLAGGKGRVAAR